MTIQSTPQMTPQANVESLVGNQKQEYPKPSIPVEMPIEKPVTTPVEGGNYNGKVNEAKNTVEANAKNAQQDAKEAEMNDTQSLNRIQTLALKANTTQNKIEAYAAGAGIDVDTNNAVEVATNQDRIDSQNELKTIQEGYKKQQGYQTYVAQMGVVS